MLPITINGNKYQLPTSWDEVTFEQESKLYESDADNRPAMIVSAFTGIDYEVAKNIDAAEFIKNIMPHIAFVNTPRDYFKIPVPNEITVNGKTIQVQQQVGKLPFGMYSDATLLIESNQDKSMYSIASKLCSIFLQQQYTAVLKGIELKDAYDGGETYDKAAAYELELQLNQQNGSVIMPLSGFFLTKLKHYERKNLKNLTQTQTQKS